MFAALETVAVYIGMLGIDFSVESAPELVDHLRELAERYARAAGVSSPEGDAIRAARR